MDPGIGARLFVEEEEELDSEDKKIKDDITASEEWESGSSTTDGVGTVIGVDEMEQDIIAGERERVAGTGSDVETVGASAGRGVCDDTNISGVWGRRWLEERVMGRLAVTLRWLRPQKFSIPINSLLAL